MLGMVGIIVNNNQIQNTIQVAQEIKPGEKYLVQFMNPPSFCRVINLEEIQQWLLFPDQKAAQAWVAASKEGPAVVPPVPPAPPGEKEDGKSGLSAAGNGSGKPADESPGDDDANLEGGAAPGETKTPGQGTD